MTIGRRSLLIAIPLALLVSTTASQAGGNGSWDGNWTGTLNEKTTIAVKIADGKVVSYAIEGAAFDVQYSAVTPTSVSFGDWDHYAVKLTRTSDTTAWELARGRDGYGSASLTKQ